MFPVGFPVYTTCGALQTECTLAQRRYTPVIGAPMEVKPHNPTILLIEVVVITLAWGGGGYDHNKPYPYSMISLDNSLFIKYDIDINISLQKLQN